MDQKSTSRLQRVLHSVEVFFTGWRFPSLVLFVLGLFAALEAAVLLIPPDTVGLGAFAETFRTWCIGYDPATRSMRSAEVIATFAELIGFMVIIYFFWRPQLRQQARAGLRTFWPTASAAVVVIAGLVLGFALLNENEALTDEAFPARSLRTELKVPTFSLVDHTGATVSSGDFEGRVVLVTAVYASCGLACPRILGQAKRAVAKLSPAEQRDVAVLGITLDPVKDDQLTLARMARAQKVEPPLYRFLTGDEGAVNRALDDFNVLRARNPETGVIDHANVFILIDRQGRLAYRLGLSDQQERWLTDALHLLVAEHPPVATLAPND